MTAERSWRYRKYVNQDVVRAREELDLARTKSTRLQQELASFAATPNPAAEGTDPAELRLLRECSEWIGKLYAAEHALFAAEHGTPGIVGAHGEYRWLTSVDRDISSLLHLCPDVVLERYLAVTSIDGGALHLTEQEKNSGWWTADEGKMYCGLPDGQREDRDDWRVAYSPLLHSTHGLPNEAHDECCAGFDEWYVFERPPMAGEIEVFVNWCGLRLYDPGWQWVVDRFWEQMAKLAPESYIAEGTVFTFATRNVDLFTGVLAAFSADLK